MNCRDLTQYRAVRGQLRAGDVLVFYGNTPLDRLIELPTGGPSHSAIVLHPYVQAWAGTPEEDVVLEESTINSSRNGVQHNYLGASLAGYAAGSSAAALLLDEATRGRIDWLQFYKYIGSIDGVVKYDIPGLFEFLLPEALDRAEPTKEMVCSVTVGAILSHCGALDHVNYGRLRPQDLVELGIYRRAVPLLGNPPLHGFNTIH